VSRADRLRSAARFLPTDLWLISGSTLVFFTSWSMVFPFLGVHMVSDLHASTSAVGIVLSTAYFAAIPVQMMGGNWADRHGRKSLMVSALVVSALLFAGLALSDRLWLTTLLAVAQGASGWPLFLVASNAIVADMTPVEHRTEAYALVRMALNVGAAAGPALAGLALASHVAFASIFTAASALCAALALLLAILFRETRPAASAAAVQPAVLGGAAAGYRRVLADRRFLAFCAVGLLTLYCFGHLPTTLPVFLTSVLHVRASTWGYLFAFECVFVVVFQYPAVRCMRGHDPLPLLALAAALMAIGIGGMAFARAGWQLWLLISICGCGEILFVPLSNSVVSLLASESERGRYMALWSLVWISGQGLAPAVDALVGRLWTLRAAYALVIGVGFVAAVLYLAYAAVERRRPAAARSESTAI
jgi:MFS family permease